LVSIAGSINAGILCRYCGNNLYIALCSSVKVEKEVATASKNIPVSVILYLKEQAAFQQDPNYLQLYQDKQKDSEQFGDYVVEFLQRSAREQQELLVQTLEALPDVKRIRSLYVANAVVIDITSSEVLEEIRKLDVVERVESNRWFRVKLENDKQYDAFSGIYDPYLRLQADRRSAGYINDVVEESQEKADNNPEWNIEWIHATELWNESITGKDLIYGNADTGVNYLHESLVDNYLGRKVSKEGNITFDHNYAWFDGVKDSDVGKKFVNKRLEEPFDDNGHGTHTTSTAIGRKGVGVAPGAKWMACRNMINGVGSPETYLACLQFFLAPTGKYMHVHC
jgi:subtilisin family serine protease